VHSVHKVHQWSLPLPSWMNPTYRILRKKCNPWRTAVHKIHPLLDCFDSVFLGQLISKRSWLPRCRDLSPPHFLFVDFKNIKHSYHPRAQKESEVTIQHTANGISNDILTNSCIFICKTYCQTHWRAFWFSNKHSFFTGCVSFRLF